MTRFTTICFVALALTGACKSSAPDKIGVAECDAYEDQMAACAAKVGGKVADQLTKMRTMMIDPWKQSAADSAQKAELPKTCASASADMKKQLPQCDWGGGAGATPAAGSN